MLPAGIPNGYELELGITEGGSSEGFFPQGFHEVPTVCGQAFTFEVTSLAAGTYGLAYEVYDPEDFAAPAFSGKSTNQFTVTDGATVEFNPTF
jgi:hypothetical protein